MYYNGALIIVEEALKNIIIIITLTITTTTTTHGGTGRTVQVPYLVLYCFIQEEEVK